MMIFGIGGIYCGVCAAYIGDFFHDGDMPSALHFPLYLLAFFVGGCLAQIAWNTRRENA
jgi:hypothetical protein